MLFKRKGPKNITCPRCGLKMPAGTSTCEDCGLIFERLDFATNKDAKRKIKRGDRDFIIRTTKLPSDVKYWKLLLMVIFTGLVGGHGYYVGRYLKGIIYSLLMVVTILCAIVFNQVLVENYEAWMEIIGACIVGPYGVAWLVDIFLVATKKFKVPVAIDLQSQDIDEVINEKN